MILNAFTVYDSKAEAYLQPFFTTTPALAMRSFQQAANTEGHDFNQYAADYTLFHIGAYDDATAQLQPLAHFGNLGTALSFINSEGPNEPLVKRALESIELNRTAKGA